MNVILFFIIILYFIFNIKKPNGHLKKKKCLKTVRFNNTPQIKYFTENFYGNPYKGDYTPDDEYYIDRLGTKGYLYNKINDIKECNIPENINKIKKFNNVIHKLELYRDDFYSTPEEYDYDELKKTSCLINKQKLEIDGYPCPGETRLNFNQGVLYSTNDQYKLGL